MKPPVSYKLYRAMTDIAAPAVNGYLRRRLKKGKEDAARFSERLGEAALGRPPGPLIWLHGASVGEALSLLPLIDALRDTYPQAALLLTTGTRSSADLIGPRLPDGVLHQFVPVDRVAYVRRFLDHWLPDLALWAESELWPNLITEIAARNIPLALVNGRVSDRSFAQWQRLPRLAGFLLNRFTVLMGQTETDRGRLEHLSQRADVICPGNLKLAAPPLPVPAGDLATLEDAVRGRPVWVAASTHKGEEDIAWRCHQALVPRHPRLLTVIAPRHPDRADAIEASLAARGANVTRRTSEPVPGPDTDIYLADTFGELGVFFRLSGLAFMGKSLAAKGGQNPFEAVQLGAYVLHGPHMGNFAHMVADLHEAGAGACVTDEVALADMLDVLMSNPPKLDALRANARTYGTGGRDIIARIMAAIEPAARPLLPPGTRP